LLDTRGQIATWSGPAAAMFGWTSEEAIGDHFALLLSPDDAPDAAASLAKASGASNFELRAECRRKDGSALPAITSLTSIPGDAGAIVGYWLVVRDISALQQSATAIADNDNIIKSILANAPDAMIGTDDQGVVISFNGAAEALFGYTSAEVVGRNVSLLMPPPDREMHEKYMAKYRASDQRRIIGTSRRVLGQRKNGTLFPHTLHVAEARVGGQRVFNGFLRDLTEQEAAAAELAELQAELLHVSRLSAMGTMASTLAHELNQPITAIANYVETSLALLNAADADRAVIGDALTEAAQQAHRAGKIVHRVREFFARGKVDKTSEALPALVDDACALGLIGAAQRGIVVECDIAPGISPVLVDRVQIQQVLINLMRNAVEAIAPGKRGIVRITARPRGNFAHITVTDNGIGLPEGLEERLFSAFVTTKRDGMGLGLSICRTIIESHGGRIWAEKRPVGTAFHFTLPKVQVDADV
jgi:two-component system sensor kinase FixL